MLHVVNKVKTRGFGPSSCDPHPISHYFVGTNTKIELWTNLSLDLELHRKTFLRVGSRILGRKVKFSLKVEK
jgi:hypothetical protein